MTLLPNPSNNQSCALPNPSSRAAPSASRAQNGSMRGEVKLLGGLNGQTGPDNCYGFISAPGERDVVPPLAEPVVGVSPTDCAVR